MKKKGREKMNVNKRKKERKKKERMDYEERK